MQLHHNLVRILQAVSAVEGGVGLHVCRAFLGQLDALLAMGMLPFDSNLQWVLGLGNLPLPRCRDWGQLTLVVQVKAHWSSPGGMSLDLS